MSKKMGHRWEEGAAYFNLGVAYHCVGNFKTAKEYHEHSLRIEKILGDRSQEGKAYLALGNVYSVMLKRRPCRLQTVRTVQTLQTECYFFCLYLNFLVKFLL